MSRYNEEILNTIKSLPLISLWDLIYHYILLTLIRNNGNKSKTARELKVNYRTFQARIRELDFLGYPIPKNNFGRQTGEKKDANNH